MKKVLKYSVYDLIRSLWVLTYLLFYLLLSSALLLLTRDHTQAITTLLNIVVVLTPLLSILFGIIFFYSSREFTNLLLAQPLSRSSIFLGQYLGVATMQAACILVGLIVPFTIFGVWSSPSLLSFVNLLGVAVFLTLIFTALAYFIGLKYENRVKGVGVAIFTWLFLAVVYDGIFLLLLAMFRDYPLENVALMGVLMNPIDLSRVLVMINLDIAALMGFTGAVFKQVLGDYRGFIVACIVLSFWVILPLAGFLHTANHRDF